MASCFPEDATLLPVPRSSPLKDEHSLWPALRICQELVQAKVASLYIPAIVRRHSVNASHLARAGERPNPIDHFSSINFEPMLLGDSKCIVLVDDVVTRGATFMGIAARIFDHMPSAEIRCFALLRPTRGEFDKVLDPVRGDITHHDGTLIRRP